MNAGHTFLVTGGNGYLGSWIVALLLEDGHAVRTSVRGPIGSPRYRHLDEMAAQWPGRLTVHEAALTDAGAFASLADGCDFVIHTASPFMIGTVADPEREFVRPAVEGTRNVLEAANRASSVRRVVLTSSVYAICADAADGRRLGRPLTEDVWNTTSSLQYQPYAYSKTVAERTAWEIAGRQQRWDLVAVNPGFILGPDRSGRATGVSHTIMKNYANGTYRSGIPEIWYAIVDVRDVARAHITAALTPGASGRYILSSESDSLWGIARRLRTQFGDRYPLPARKAPKALVWLIAPRLGFTRPYVSKNVGIPVHVDNSRSRRDLGVQYRPVDETLGDHFRQVLGELEGSQAGTTS